MVSPSSLKPARTKIDHQLRVLFDNSSEFKICMLDLRGRIIGWNKGAEQLTGYTAKEILGKNYSFFISEKERRHNIIGKTLSIAAKRGQFVAEGIRVRKDGTHFWARSVITPLKAFDESIKFFVVITKNISREHELEQKREEYIGIASHELKNPLTTLSLYSELLGKRLELETNKKNLHTLHDIQLQTTRLVALVDDLLIVSKIEGGTLELQKEIFNPTTFVAQLVKVFQKSTRSHKIIIRSRSMGLVRADKNRLTQVLINLLTNAVKYSPRADTVLVQVGQYRGKCVISTHDFGPGIEKSDQKEIFSRFFRANNAQAGNVAGAGLGLYISKEIMKKHRERLWVKSIKGKGTTFSFTVSFARGRTMNES